MTAGACGLPLAEVLAVVAGDDDERVAGASDLLEKAQQAADVRVCVGDAAVVERLDVLALLRPERERAVADALCIRDLEALTERAVVEILRVPAPAIGNVHLVGVDEHEEALGCVLVQPALDGSEGALDPLRAVGARGDPVLLPPIVEAAVESELARDVAALR